jgi:hypothetical protein
MNALIDAMFCSANAVRTNGQTWFPERDTINIVFDGTNARDRLCELLVNLVTDFGEASWLREGHRSQFHNDFLLLALEDRTLDDLDPSLSKACDTAKFLQYKPEEDGAYRDIDKAVPCVSG